MSTLNVSNISDGTDTVGTSYVVNGSAKAWLQIGNAASTPTINNSLNVSSITDLGTGQFDMTATNGFADNDSSFTASNRSVSTGLGVFTSANGNSNWVVYTRNGSSTFTDYNFSSTVHGDLA